MSLLSAAAIFALSTPAAGAKREAWPDRAAQLPAEAAHAPAVPDMKQSVCKRKGRWAQAVADFVIKAPPTRVWDLLTDFPQYPRIFDRLQSCRVVKREGDLIYTESRLKPHVFVRTQLNHTVNDLRGKPNTLDWELIDGNFRAVHGRWSLAPEEAGQRCRVIYTLEVDPGPVIPPFLVSFVLGFVQKEIVASLKEAAESAPAAPVRQARLPAAQL